MPDRNTVMDDAWDVIVVGAGTAGLPAALFASRRGANVLVVEQSDRVGGTLHVSKGHMSAAGTVLQAEQGINDSPSAHFEDIMRISNGRADSGLVRLSVEEAPNTLGWLMDEGFDMSDDCPSFDYFHEKYSVPRTYWGKEDGLSVLRVLEPLVESAQGGGKLTIRFETMMTGLLRDSNGEVTGISMEDSQGASSTARGSNVVMTTGGYGSNPELFERLSGFPLVSAAPETSNGTGILAAEAIDAEVHGQWAFLPSFGGISDGERPGRAVPVDDFPLLSPQYRKPWEIYVNGRAQRFVAEDTESVYVREQALLAQPGLMFWVVFDEKIRTEAPPLLPNWTRERLSSAFDTHPSFVAADTIVALALAADVPSQTLAQTVSEYNAACEAGTCEFGRTNFPAPIDRPPFYAIRNHGVTMRTTAGLKVDTRLRVVDRRGRPIEHLYAAGEALGSATFAGGSFVGGMGVTSALSLGRLLGRSFLKW